MFRIRGRHSWGARPLRSITSQRPGDVHTLVVHHTAGAAPSKLADAKRQMREIERQHMDDNGWSGPGYNVVIDRAGRVWEARGLHLVGAHTLGHNTRTFGVSFMGNYETMELNRRQRIAYFALKRRLRLHGFRFVAIRGHRQMPNQATACPGKNVMRQLGL